MAVLTTILFGAGYSLHSIHGFVSEAHCRAAHSSPSAAATRPLAQMLKSRVCDVHRVLAVNPSSSLSWRRSAWF
jgi:hypothetical protein